MTSEITNEMDVEDYVGFYTKNHFWVGKRIDWEDQSSTPQLHGIVPEIQFVWMAENAFKAAVTIDGLILLHIQRLASTAPSLSDPHQFQIAITWWREYLDFVHSLQILLESATIEFGLHNKISASEISSSQTCTVGMQNWSPVRSAFCREQNNLTTRFGTLEWVHGGRVGVPTIEVTDTYSFNYAVVSIEMLQRVFSQFEIVIRNQKAIKWLSILTKSKSAYERGDFQVSFILAWFVIESCCRQMIREFEEVGVEKNKTMHVIEKILLDKKILDADLYSSISSLRKVRNELVHEPDSEVCIQENCFIAHGVALNLACRDFPFPVFISLNYSMSY